MWWCAAAFAGEGFWHPDDLAPLSQLYARTSVALQEPFEAHESALEAEAAALREYRVALGLLGPRALPAELERLESLERTFARRRAEQSEFADEVGNAYGDAFMAAVKAAAAGAPMCEAERAVQGGPRMPGMPPRTEPNPDCRGENLNARLAAAVDADPALAATLEAIVKRPWPELAPLDLTPQTAVGPASAERWVSVAALLRGGARDALLAVERDDDVRREEVEAQLEGRPGPEQLEALKQRVRAIEAETAAKYAAVGVPVLEAALARMAKKWKAEPPTGFCANPARLGGCAGTDATRELVPRLLEDPKVAAAMP